MKTEKKPILIVPRDVISFGNSLAVTIQKDERELAGIEPGARFMLEVFDEGGEYTLVYKVKK